MDVVCKGWCTVWTNYILITKTIKATSTAKVHTVASATTLPAVRNVLLKIGACCGSVDVTVKAADGIAADTDDPSGCIGAIVTSLHRSLLATRVSEKACERIITISDKWSNTHSQDCTDIWQSQLAERLAQCTQD